jgi:hypothetical protein
MTLISKAFKIGGAFEPGGTLQADLTNTPARLSAVTVPAQGVIFKAPLGNVGTARIAFTEAAAPTGFILAPGESSGLLPIGDLNQVWLVSSAAAGDTLSIIYWS